MCLNKIVCWFISSRQQQGNYWLKKSLINLMSYSWSTNKRTNPFIFCFRKLKFLSQSRIKQHMDCWILFEDIFWTNIIIIWLQLVSYQCWALIFWLELQIETWIRINFLLRLCKIIHLVNLKILPHKINLLKIWIVTNINDTAYLSKIARF